MEVGSPDWEASVLQDSGRMAPARRGAAHGSDPRRALRCDSEASAVAVCQA